MIKICRSIEAGEAIVVEDPIAAHLSPYKMPLNCQHCFRMLGDTVLPSPVLRKARWVFHIFFCRFSAL